MTGRIIAATMLTVGLAGLASIACGPFDFTLETTVSLDLDRTIPDGLQSIFEVDYTTSMFKGITRSEFQEFGFLWQEFGAVGRLGVLDLRVDVLFGPSTADYLYTQLIAEMGIGGLQFGLHYAQLSDAVLDGWADGFALRTACSIGSLDLVSITEFGARIAADDFDGITVVHTASGFSRSYLTDPVVPGQGFTGQKATISGLSFGRVDEIETTLYLDSGGFQLLSFKLEGIESGMPWLGYDVEVTFEVEDKSATITPEFIIGEGLCLASVLDITPVTAAFSLDALVLGGCDLAYSRNGATLRDVIVLNPKRYVITTPEDGSVLELLEDAIEDGHEYNADYWQLLSLEIDRETSCGLSGLLVSSYFKRGSREIFGWGMSYLEGSMGIGSGMTLSLSLTLDSEGFDDLDVGFAFNW